MNEFERRFIEIAENHLLIKQAVAGAGSNVIIEYYGYPLQIGSAANPLVNGVTQEGFIAIQADAWFVLEYFSLAVCLPNGSTFGDHSQLTQGGNINLQITDTGAGEDLYNGPGPAALVAGSPAGSSSGTGTGGPGGIPFVFPTPRLIPPNTNIKIDVTQLGLTALTNPQPDGVFIMLNGARVALV